MSGPLAQFAFTADLPQQQLRLHSRRTMIAISHMIEDYAAQGGAGTTLIAAFQRLSLYTREIPRYRTVASVVADITVFGVADVVIPQLPGVRIVPLEKSWPLVQEWVVIVRGPDCSLALLARDVEGFQHQRLSQRFHGLWVTNSSQIDSIVTRCYAAAELAVPVIKRNHEATLQTALRARRELALRLREYHL